MKKQSPVEFLIKQINKSNAVVWCQVDYKHFIKQAKEMEAEKDAKYNKMVEMLKRIYEIENDTFLSIDIEELIKEATEFKNK